MDYQASNPESLSETSERLSKTKTRSGSPAAAAKKRAAVVLHFLHKLEQLDDCGETVQFARASPGSDVIPDDLKSPGVGTFLPITMTFSYQNFVLVIIKRSSSFPIFCRPA